MADCVESFGKINKIPRVLFLKAKLFPVKNITQMFIKMVGFSRTFIKQGKTKGSNSSSF